MGGGHIQLIALGAQDIYVIGNPQITFFKSVYRRHTNFSMECIEVTNSNSINTNETTLNYSVGRHGDLLYKCHLEIDFPEQDLTLGTSKYGTYCNNTAHSYVKQIDFEIGNKLIDRHYGLWYDIRNSLWDKDNTEKSLLNKHDDKIAYLRSDDTSNVKSLKVFCPFHFWFCEESGQALPLIALQYHEIDFKITYRGIKDIINSTETISGVTANTPTIKLWCNYIYLDSDERRKFAQVSHEYLIEQLQVQENSFNSNIQLNLNHPVKGLYWVIRNNTAITSSDTNIDTTNNVQTETSEYTHKNDYLNYSRAKTTSTNEVRINNNIIQEHFDKGKIVLNGIDRFNEQSASYFRLIEPYNSGNNVQESKLIYMYSFSLKPLDYQPSGMCNFSRIDSAYLNFSGNLSSGYTISVFAVNYNVLRIMSGMGGLLFSN
jgi:hypothetical protein